MISLFKVNFCSPHTEVDGIKIMGASIFGTSQLNPGYLKQYIEDIRQGLIRVSDLLPMSEDESKILYPVPPFPIKSSGSTSRSKRITQGMHRKKKLHYQTIEKIREMAKFMNEVGIDGDYLSKFEDIPGQVDDFSEYAVSLEELTPKVYVRELTQYGPLAIRKINGKDIIASKTTAFLAEYNNEMFIESMNFLQDRGLSGNLSRGKGKFIYRQGLAHEQAGFNGPGHYLLLSKFCPSKDDLTSIDFEKSYYNLNFFYGRTRTGAVLSMVRYIEPGALLYIKNKVNGILAENPQENGESSPRHFGAVMVRVI